MTVAINVIAKLFQNTLNVNKKHAQTLVGERPAGSQWGEEMHPTKLTSLPWQQLDKNDYVDGVHLPFCDYYFLSEEDVLACIPQAQQNMELISTCRERGYNISTQPGAHGDNELVSEHIKPRFCSTAWLIVGPAENEAGEEIEGQQMIWTTYPGEITARVKPDWDGDIASLDGDHFAVKGIG